MAGSRISNKYREYGCNEQDVVMMAVATRDSTEEILYYYGRNGCDSVQFSMITLEGGAAEIGELFGMSGKAGPTFLIAPDKTISEKLFYSDHAIDKCFSDAGISPAECDDTLLAPTIRFVRPRMDEVVQPDSLYEISWVSRDSDGISASVLYLSDDNGKSWTYVDSIVGADSTYNFKMPNLYSEECRLKIHVYDTKNYMREKVSIYFTIDGKVSTVENLNSSSLFPIGIEGGFLSVDYLPEGEIRITDLSGRVLKEIHLEKHCNRYNWKKGLGAGVYMVSLYDKGVKQASCKISIR